MADPTPFPLPGDAGVVAAPAPGAGPGWWAGAPGVVRHPDGGFVVGYRVRHGHDGFDENVIATSDARGETLTEVVRLPASHFGARWIERPAIVPLADGGWRLYVCLGREVSKMWWIEALDAPSPAGLGDAASHPTLALDDRHAMKDPMVERDENGWRAWVCAHLLDIPGDEDRMETMYATSADGLDWTWHGTVLRPRQGAWDQRGARLSSVLPDGRAAYDGRASAAENWFERTGIAVRDATGAFTADADPRADIRYLTAMPLTDSEGGGHRIWWEQRLPDESHELRTEHVPAGADDYSATSIAR